MNLTDAINANVEAALLEDVGDGDLTAALVDATATGTARIIAREPLVLAGQHWVDAVFQRLDQRVTLEWAAADGSRVAADSVICKLTGPARTLLTGERTALNFLQTLSGTATETARYVAAVAHTGARILDTRKTLPGLRVAQKYAVRCGGGHNHRFGLYDAVLIKENHIASAGSVEAAMRAAHAQSASVPIEIEVETLQQMRAVLAAGATRLLLDNFDINALREAVSVNRAEGRPPAELEASGGLTLDELRAVAETGIDYISVGALTKHVHAIDFSMRFA